MSVAGFNRGESRQDFETPNDFMAAVVKRFGTIDTDLAASPANAKAQHFVTKEDNSLTRPWYRMAGLCWLNPPFENITPWAQKCAASSCEYCQDGRLHAGAKILFLTPASVGSNWFSSFVHGKALVLALNGRLTFKGCPTPYPKDCILSCYGFTPGFEVWKWK